MFVDPAVARLYWLEILPSLHPSVAGAGIIVAFVP